ncbi:MAG: AbrB/MazE/SpoVT family DNA-binding domain-containing protein [Thermodesulfobacteriota bacterium]
MLRKISPIGNSQGVSIPREMLEKLHLSVGSRVEVEVDKKTKRIIIKPKAEKARGSIDKKFASQVDEFIERYRPALKALSK